MNKKIYYLNETIFDDGYLIHDNLVITKHNMVSVTNIEIYSSLQLQRQ